MPDEIEKDDKELLKIDQLDKTFVFRDKYYDSIKRNLPKNENNLFRHIGKYRDKNVDILSSMALMKYPVFAKTDYNIVFDTVGLHEDDIATDTVAFSKANKVNIVNFKPVDIVLVMMIKYYWETNQPKKVEPILYYISYSFYWMIWLHFFYTKRIPPKQEVMDYVVNNMTNKFVLKQTGSLDGLLYYATSNVIDCYKDRVIRCSDQDLYYIINYIRSRINSFTRKVANEYFTSVDNHDMMFSGSDTLEDGTTRISTAIVSQASSYADEYTTKFFSEKPRRDIIDRASKLKGNGVSTAELYDTLVTLVDEQKIDEIKSFYSSMFYIFLTDNEIKNKDIKSISFIAAMEMVYKKGNSGDKNINNIKKLLDSWLTESSNTYRISDRQATLNNFRKALFYYFVLLASSNK